MQRRASSRKGAGKASVGQASRQAVQEPQCSVSASSGSSARVVKTSPRKNQLPWWRDSRLACLPCQPSPAAWAKGFSMTGAVSTKTFTSASKRACIQRASALSRFFTVSW